MIPYILVDGGDRVIGLVLLAQQVNSLFKRHLSLVQIQQVLLVVSVRIIHFPALSLVGQGTDFSPDQSVKVFSSL